MRLLPLPISVRPAAASVPVPLNEEHPCAVQLASHSGKDHLILQLAAQLEQELRWDRCHPDLGR